MTYQESEPFFRWCASKRDWILFFENAFSFIFVQAIMTLVIYFIWGYIISWFYWNPYTFTIFINKFITQQTGMDLGNILMNHYLPAINN